MKKQVAWNKSTEEYTLQLFKQKLFTKIIKNANLKAWVEKSRYLLTEGGGACALKAKSAELLD
jgi:hypothetical protein